MPSAEHSVDAPRLNSAVEWVAYLGVAPLIVCLAAVGLLPGYAARELAQRCAIGWGATLLGFQGAVHFGLALAGRLPWQRERLGAPLVPAVIGAAAVVIGGQRGLALLVVGHGGLWLYEHRVLGAQLPQGYLSVRRPVVLASCVLLALTMFISDAAGLP
jgi:uncharacterized membrane protein YeaQ/YmgE (transglycosylase-associated protein family)